MKTATGERRLGDLDSRDASPMHLRIHLWPPVRFSQPILIKPQQHPKDDFREAHSARMRGARARSRALPNRSSAAGRPIMRFPGFSPREKRTLKQKQL